MRARGWDAIDILIVSGDAYVDHPAFGPVLVARFLEARGYRVGFVAQPRWDRHDDVLRMGRPRLFAGISAGNLDSMLNKLTAQKKVRSDDPYSPGGRTGLRPNRATIVYANLVRAAMPGVPIVLGGIEASLRRIAHYDYWSDEVRRSILLDAKADLLVFGMGERPAWEIAERLAAGEPVHGLRDVRGTAHVLGKGEWEDIEATRYVADGKPLFLPSYEEVSSDKRAFSEMSRLFQYETNPGNARSLLQPHGVQAVYLNPPAEPDVFAALDATLAALAQPSSAARQRAHQAVFAAVASGHLDDSAAIILAAAIGDNDGAFALAERAFLTDQPSNRDTRPNTKVLLRPATAALRRDPRFAALAARLGLTAYWKSNTAPDFCLRETVAPCMDLKRGGR